MAKFETIMVVDDEDIDQRIYRRILERSGMVRDILQYTAPQDALTWLSNHPDDQIDILFLDIKMPLMTGFEFLAALETLTPAPKIGAIFLLSTSLDPRDTERADAHPLVKGFFCKPLDPPQLDKAAEILAS